MTGSSGVRTLLLGLDGATFTVLDPLMQRGVMPFLREFMASGVRAPLRSILPPLTPPGWTSLMTGQRPGQHGVFDFFQKRTVDDEHFHFANSLDVHSATIWSLASEAGKRVISLNFPLMFPPPPVNGSVVPGGWMPWRQLRLGCHPPGLFDRLKELPSFNARELALDMEMEAKAIEGCEAEEYADWIDLHIRRERRWCDILTHLLGEEPADLVGVVFDGVDKIQHLCWRFLDPACQPGEPSAWERDIIARCESYFRQLDGILAELVAVAGLEALVVMASDHGFGPSRDIFYVNSWLERQGYLRWTAEADTSSAEAPKVGFGQLARHVYQLDWEHTVAYAATPSSQGIHIVRKPEQSEREYLRLREELAADLSEVRLPSTGRPLADAVWFREDAFAGPHQALAPDITLELNDGVALSILRSDSLFAHRDEPKGNHRWDGIFAAVGPGVRRDAVESELSIVDVAPLLLYGLDLPVPSEMAGRVPSSIFEPGHLRQRAPRLAVGAGTRGPAPSAPEVVLDDDEEEAVLRRLRALGYVD